MSCDELFDNWGTNWLWVQKVQEAAILQRHVRLYFKGMY